MYIQQKTGYTMITPKQLETAYQEFVHDLNKWIPDGITTIDLHVLNQLGLLQHEKLDTPYTDTISRYFQIIETDDKVTLFNEQFAVWIVPKLIEGKPITLTYIALLQQDYPHLEMAFSTAGVYNAPKYILTILHQFLKEVVDTEAVISSIDKKKPKKP